MRLSVVAAALCLGLATGWARADGPSVAWRVVDRCGSAIPIYRNSHATAAAWVTAYHGLRKSNESNNALISSLWVRMQWCDCDAPGKPICWNTSAGLQDLFKARGYGGTAFKERCRYANDSGETASFDDYVNRIHDNLPVVVTFCYDPDARSGVKVASRRASHCLSVVGVGQMIYNGEKLLICHDGLSGNETSAASEDRVSPASLGLPTAGKPWGQAGTSLYRWKGSYENLIMLFVGSPSR